MDVGAVEVRHDPTSAAVVRRAIADDLTAHAVIRDSIEDVVLVASELVGNAVMHAEATGPDDASLDISWIVSATSVLVAVGDGSTAVPQPRDARVDQPGGRGLAIVAALADDWGVEPTHHGKRVWARVPIRTA